MIHITLTCSSNKGRDYYRVQKTLRLEFADETEGKKFYHELDAAIALVIASGAAKRVDAV